ncbi:MAG: DUF3343 domain-containing protein [Ruminococcaceae bacterium]|nr:DUF3343 domain-containing protein [Oscillospiraceae bacterium]
MQKIFINFPSVTFAMKSEKILGVNKINCSLIKTPSKFSGCGCGYSIVIDLKDLDTAKRLLYDNNIRINDIKVSEV